jgi:hypothetical protein
MRESWTLAALRTPCFVLLLVLSLPEGVRAYNLVRVADLDSPIPGGSGTFTSLSTPQLSGSNVAFRGLGGAGQEGIYLFNGTERTRVADLTTMTPDGTGTFTSLSPPLLSESNVAFVGRGGAGQEGIYLFNGTTLIRIADRTTTIPGGSGTFTSFSFPALSGGNVAFRGLGGAGQQGIYLFSRNELIRVADLTTVTPAGNGTFTGFEDPLLSGANVAFRASGGSGKQGIYLFSGTKLLRIVDLTIPIPDFGSGTFTSVSFPALSGGNVAFIGSVVNPNLPPRFGFHGIYLFNALISPAFRPSDSPCHPC